VCVVLCVPIRHPLHGCVTAPADSAGCAARVRGLESFYRCRCLPSCSPKKTKFILSVLKSSSSWSKRKSTGRRPSGLCRSTGRPHRVGPAPPRPWRCSDPRLHSLPSSSAVDAVLAHLERSQILELEYSRVLRACDCPASKYTEQMDLTL
jgi:hypothetical protein